MVSVEEVEISVDEAPETDKEPLHKRRKVDNGSSDQESELQVVDEVNTEPPFIEEVMDEGGGEDVDVTDEQKPLITSQQTPLTPPVSEQCTITTMPNVLPAQPPPLQVPKMSNVNPVGMTAQALLETLFTQVLAHSMHNNVPNANLVASPTMLSNSIIGSTISRQDTNGQSAVEADQFEQQIIPQIIPQIVPQIVPQQMSPLPAPTQRLSPNQTLQNNNHSVIQAANCQPLKDTLEKITLLEQNTAQLDKQSLGLQKMVTEVVKKQEENVQDAGLLCPRCRQYVGSGEEFISHLLNKHNFKETKGPTQSHDFQGQAGLGTCRGWRYIRTKNSGTQSILSMVTKSDQNFIDLTATSTSPTENMQSESTASTAIPVSHSGSVINVTTRQSPRPPPPKIEQLASILPTPPQNVNAVTAGLSYDSARATAAGLLSFVFGNPDISKQFNDYADMPTKEELVSPKKVPAGFSNLPPFLQNKFLHQNGLGTMFDRMKDKSAFPPNLSLVQQKELMTQAFKHQQHVQMQQQHQLQAQQHQLHQQQQMQQQQLQQQHAQQAAAQQRAMHAGIIHPAPIHSSPLQHSPLPLQPTPLQAQSLQQIRPHPHGSTFNLPTPISVGELKEYQNMFGGAGQKMSAFDVSSDSPLKDCHPKVRASLVNGDIQLMWNIIGDERKCTGYRLFAYMGVTAPPISTTWTEVGTVKALPMPMAVTLSQFSKGCSYHFTVRAIDSKGNLGPFSEPCSIKLSI